MQNANKRTDAKELEALMMSSTVELGQGAVADFVGMDRSQVSRWMTGKDSMLLKFCRWYEFTVARREPGFLAFAGDEVAEIAHTLRLMNMMFNPKKQKRPVAAERSEQITMSF